MSGPLLAKTTGCQVGIIWMIWLYFITWKYLRTLLGVPNSHESGSFTQFISESILRRSRNTSGNLDQTWLDADFELGCEWWCPHKHKYRHECREREVLMCLHFDGLVQNTAWPSATIHAGISLSWPREEKRGFRKKSIETKNGTDSATNEHTLWKWPATCTLSLSIVGDLCYVNIPTNTLYFIRCRYPSDSFHNPVLIFPDSLYIFTHSVFQLEINAVWSIQSFFMLIITSEEVTQSIIHVGCWINMSQCLYAHVAAGWLFFFLFSFRIKCYLHHRLFHAGVAQIQSKIDSALCLCVFA